MPDLPDTPENLEQPERRRGRPRKQPGSSDSPQGPPGEPPGEPPVASPGGLDGSDDPEQQLARFFRALFATEILPQFQQILDARLVEVRAWVSQQILPLTQNAQDPQDPQVLARQVSAILGPELNRALNEQADPIVQLARTLGDRVAVLEGRPASPAPAPQGGPGVSLDASPSEAPQGDRVSGPMGFAAIAESFIDIAVEKLLPAMNSFQQMKQTNRLFSMDPAAIETFRKANPAYSIILANQLAPDQNMMGLLNQLPFITANAIGVGMKARVMAPQLVSGGGAAWPGTPGSGLPGFSPSLPGGLSPAPPGPATRASMQNRRSRPSKQGRTGFLSSRITPINEAKPPAPKRLSDLLG